MNGTITNRYLADGLALAAGTLSSATGINSSDTGTRPDRTPLMPRSLSSRRVPLTKPSRRPSSSNARMHYRANGRRHKFVTEEFHPTGMINPDCTVATQGVQKAPRANKCLAGVEKDPTRISELCSSDDQTRLHPIFNIGLQIFDRCSVGFIQLKHLILNSFASLHTNHRR